MNVLAAKGTKCPMEGQPRKYILDTPPAEETGYTVPDTGYYRRLVRDGSLLVVSPAAAKKGGK